MKNTETSTSEYIKADVLHKKILWRINLIGRQISECKKKFTRFYAIVQKKSDVSVGEKNENDISWVEAFDDFAENWEEMERYYARKKASLLRKIRKINKKIKKNKYKEKDAEKRQKEWDKTRREVNNKKWMLRV